MSRDYKWNGASYRQKIVRIVISTTHFAIVLSLKSEVIQRKSEKEKRKGEEVTS